ncbi:MAG TPA: TOBE domain-containing protein [Burkholderiaceae bacterium]
MTKEHAITLHGSVWMTVDGENFGSPTRIALLAKIAECGSITQAAKAVKMSYKAAWDAVDAMNNLAGEALVERLAGGKGGGGTRLTPRGAQLVHNFQAIESEYTRFVEQLGRRSADLADDYLLLRRVNMRTSARNQFFGSVASVARGSVNDEVTLDVAGGHRIVAIITHASTEALGLRAGAQACALIKASSIILMCGGGDAKLSARNQLTGAVARLLPGAVNTEIVIDLPGGGAIAAIVTNESSVALALAVGSKVTAVFDASSVILAVPD